MRGRCSYVKFGTLDNLLDRRQCPCPFCCTSAFSDQVMGVIEQRNEMIRQQFDAAQKTQDEANKMKADYEQQLDTAKEQASDIIAAARVRSEKEHSKAIADTEAERVKMLAQAREDIEKEQANAKKELQSQIMDIAMLAAKKIIMTGDQYDAKSGK